MGQSEKQIKHKFRSIVDAIQQSDSFIPANMANVDSLSGMSLKGRFLRLGAIELSDCCFGCSRLIVRSDRLSRLDVSDQV